MKKNQKLRDAESLFSALADKTRLRLLNLMKSGEVNVTIFTEVLNESQPKISRHLAYLRNSEIVETRREGKQIYYRIAPTQNEFVKEILHSVFKFFGEQPEMQQDFLSFSNKYFVALSAGETSKTNFQPDVCDYPYTSSANNELDIYLL